MPPQLQPPIARPLPPEPIVQLDWLIIRALRQSDAPAIAAAADSPLVSRYMTDQFPSPYTLHDAESWIARAAPHNFGIFVPASPESRDSFVLAGGIGLKDAGVGAGPGVMEVGYWLAPEQWGRGIATVALREFSRWAFGGDTPLRRIEAAVFSPNWRSAAVLSRAGYTFEGVRRKAAVKAGEPIDLIMFGLLREEFSGLDG